MPVYRIEIAPRTRRAGGAAALTAQLREAGLATLDEAADSRLFFVEGDLSGENALQLAQRVLADPIVEEARVWDQHTPIGAAANGAVALEVHPRPGVMDPVAESTLAELRSAGYAVERVRTARRYTLAGDLGGADVERVARRVLANDCIEQVVLGTAGVKPGPRPAQHRFELRHVSIRNRSDAELERLSREGHLFLSLEEMTAIRGHFRGLEREPTDLELETLAQTWSEHCVHKTLKSAVMYRGAPFPNDPDAGREVEVRYGNLLKETIARATTELMAANRGPECLSVFKDNAGIIAFDEETGVAFKVETHNRPSAIEPYGGAATGVGGCIRDVMGCGLGAQPIANTDVFCVAPPDWPADELPRGVLHPRRVLRGVVQGVADYGNRMGIATVNGAVQFDPRYLGNPLVFCGCIGLIPRDRIDKAARSGDRIVVVGGRTGRDGIHGATFSSAELTDKHADEFSHAVQIGNAITEKRVLDALLQARDATEGCLYSAVTDCGAGGLSSAVGEMGAEIGATVQLERVPLKYEGLRYDEIWISEAQERMVVAVPRENLMRFEEIMRAEGVEATVIGVFGEDAQGEDRTAKAKKGTPRLRVLFDGHVVGDLDMHFVHEGLPRPERIAEWRPPAGMKTARTDPTKKTAARDGRTTLNALLTKLSTPNIAAKEWVIRKYDHEVQGQSVIKPLMGPGRGPMDAAVLRPRPASGRGIAIGCGLAPHLSEIDPYLMAVAAIDEAIRNVVCVGGDPRRTAILDNFCWGRTDDPQQMGALVRACQACYDAALAYGTPFISGKDSLNNEFALDPADRESVVRRVREYLSNDEGIAGLDGGGTADEAILNAILERIRRTGRLTIPATLLISAVALLDDVTRCVTSDLKSPGNALFVVGGLPEREPQMNRAPAIHAAVADAITAKLIAAAHDVSDGGWLTALAEMAVGGTCGARLLSEAEYELGEFERCIAGYVVEARDAAALTALLGSRGVIIRQVAEVTGIEEFRVGEAWIPTEALRTAWRRGPGA